MHDTGYLHLDIKPQNFIINFDGTVKLGDFNLSRKKNKSDEDYFEGDSVYLAPEILEAKKFNQLNEKCDIFSLGLSIVEILFKIELPPNGLLWHQIRDDNFIIPNEFYFNSNIKEIPEEMLRLIYDMISFNSNNRKELNYFFENYPELKKRYGNLKNNNYKRSYENFIKYLDSEEEKDLQFSIKRSNSYMSNTHPI